MPTKTKQSETQKIPKLRFEGFSGEWEEKRLGESGLKVIDGDRGKNYPNGNDFSNEEYCLFLNASNVTKNGFLFNENVFITKEKDNNLRKGKLKRFDVVITTRGSVGHIAYYDNNVPFKNVRINSGMVSIRNENKNIDSHFVYKFFASPKIKNGILKLSSGSAQPQLTVRDIDRLKFSFPSLSEQQKIAEFLGSVDEWIENLRAQKENLEDYKKGMMQKIFSSACHSRGGGNPESCIRFKDDNGNDFAEWEEKRLGEICEITTGKLNANAMTENGKYRFYTCAKDYYQINDFAFDTEALLISGNGANVGYIHYYKGKFNAYQRTYILDEFNQNIFFIKIYLDKFLNDRINKEKKKGNTPYIVLNTLTEMKIQIPSTEEQQKIADFLTSIDNLINSKQQQITQAEQWKKGLMQGLFV